MSADAQWWLVTLSKHGNPTLVDGAHSERAGADRAMYLFQRLGLAKPGERYAVARVELSEPMLNASGVDEGEIDTIITNRSQS